MIYFSLFVFQELIFQFTGCILFLATGGVTIDNFQNVAAGEYKDTALAMGSMAIINLIAILLLSGTVAKLTKDYFAQRRVGEEPRFKSAEFPELDKGINHEIWK